MEARDRAGGRVRFAEPVPGETIELGAEFIHGPAVQTRALLAQTGGVADSREGDGWIQAAPGAPLTLEEDEFLQAGALFADIDALATDVTVDEYLATRRVAGVDPYAIERARQFVEGFDAADPARASARGIAREWNSGVDSLSARPSAGYAPLIAALERDARDAGVDIRYSTPVIRVERSLSAVRVELASHECVEARCAIVSLPIGVLRSASVLFVPQLPDQTRSAIAHIAMGDVARVVLLFRTPFWESIAGGRYRDAGFFRAADGPFRAYWTQHPHRRRSIVAWSGGPDARQLLQQSRENLVHAAVAGFGALFGCPERALAEFEDAAVHDWSADPYARGAYSYLLVGGESAREQLAAPVEGTLYFCGEATAPDGEGGTVNGAISSGERAAREVLAELARTKT